MSRPLFTNQFRLHVGEEGKTGDIRPVPRAEPRRALKPTDGASNRLNRANARVTPKYIRNTRQGANGPRYSIWRTRKSFTRPVQVRVHGKSPSCRRCEGEVPVQESLKRS